jgi:mRNA interferase RelE/StbE
LQNWTIKFNQDLKKTAKKLGKQALNRIINFLEEKILIEERHPKSFGQPLIGNLVGFWRYRIGDYRVICKIENDILVILVIDIGHRKDIYE